MQIEVLKFLLDASAHLQAQKSESNQADAGTRDDLQAVARALPDSDWFELDTERELACDGAPELWGERGLKFDF